ncbi:protein IQ-DOMAIN 10-like [Magnolia sinica]|uniref:protein IQ-DOMAIN 10-like n=1 Tax=Magnolia sinica TaxID=86752 RepID=UPI002659A83B|nr:protein IQ-DOMAIN 10-like [Magnolia sinica]XP_058100678.1 protein IQ-DOMAIN 10-like [Magnolia sinica]XP_058100679.1 protein IQ-DOMAIN 10-like [Magnolia sinica]XP_058100680.1 protein IQ-DOMAIN 10-like [Magnolia sinica]XP_058100681.1 protein IQ-DOMAIN 10-like [Magnolia sinica]
MGSGDWFKAIISLKKAKEDKSKQGSSATEKSNGFKWRHRSRKSSIKFFNGASSGNARILGMPIEDIAATRIQTAFRSFMARKALRCLKGSVRLQVVTQGHTVNKQALTTLNYLKSWSKIQAQIRARRICMVTEGRIRQKKHDNQLKLEAKLHELEVEWCGGSDTMEEILARIQQREEAAVKRERAMAYAFSHQWRANSNPNLGHVTYDFSKGWGWSWMERWISARPWESRIPVQSSPTKNQSKQASKVSKNLSPSATRTSVPVKTPSSNGKGHARVADLPKMKKLPTEKEKPVMQEVKTKVVVSSSPSTKAGETNGKQEQAVSS